MEIFTSIEAVSRVIGAVVLVACALLFLTSAIEDNLVILGCALSLVFCLGAVFWLRAAGCIDTTELLGAWTMSYLALSSMARRYEESTRFTTPLVRFKPFKTQRPAWTDPGFRMKLDWRRKRLLNGLHGTLHELFSHVDGKIRTGSYANQIPSVEKKDCLSKKECEGVSEAIHKALIDCVNKEDLNPELSDREIYRGRCHLTWVRNELFAKSFGLHKPRSLCLSRFLLRVPQELDSKMLERFGKQ